MMIRRIKQFWRAFKAKITDEDKFFIGKYLNEEEQKLFFNMQVFDQRHSLNVAYTAGLIIKEQKIEDIDEDLLFKACLLHDIARTKQDICLGDKVVNVLISKIAPKKSKIWAEQAKVLSKIERKSFWQKRRYALYLYYYHAQIGAEILAKMGLSELSEIVRYHHIDLENKINRELIILCQADNLN